MAKYKSAGGGGGGSPTGSAGGDLGGSYPNPTVVGVHDATATALTIGTLTDGGILKRSGTTIVPAVAGVDYATSGGGAPTTATYITQTPDGGLSAEQALSALATGILKSTTGTGVLSIAAAGTDYAAPSVVPNKNATFIVQTADGTLANAQAMGALATGIVKSTTTTGVQSIAVANTDYLPGVGANIIDDTGLTTTVPLLVKNAKNLSGVEAQVTGTAATGFVLRDSGGTARGVLGYAVSASDWVTSAPAGNVVIGFDSAKSLDIGPLGGARVLNIDINNMSPLINIYMGAGKKVILDSNTSLSSVVLQIAGDPNTGNGAPGGADTYSTICGGVEVARWGTTSATLADGVNLIVNATTGTKIGTATGQKLGFWNATPVVQPTNGVNLTNNVTSGGTDDTIANFTDLTIYANDAAAIRNDIYQLAKKLKVVNDALRTIGLMS